jgi:hypothetical protein
MSNIRDERGRFIAGSWQEDANRVICDGKITSETRLELFKILFAHCKSIPTTFALVTQIEDWLLKEEKK